MGERPALNSPKTQSRSRLFRSHQDQRKILRERWYALLLVSVDGQRGPPILTEILCDVVRNTLGADEDEDLGVLLGDLLEVLDELGPLLEVAHDLDNLLDVVVRSKLHGTNVDLDEVLQEILYHNTRIRRCSKLVEYMNGTYVGEFLYVLRPCGGEHEGLPIRANLAHNLADLRLETHVQHAVGLVHDKVGDPTEVRLAGLEHVDKPAGRSDHNLNAALKITNLGSLRGTAIDSSVADARVRAAAELAWRRR